MSPGRPATAYLTNRHFHERGPCSYLTNHQARGGRGRVTGGSAQAAPYDGVDPAGTSCGGTTGTVKSVGVYDHHSNRLGALDLRHNSGCRTAWARLTVAYGYSDCGNASAGIACAQARIVRDAHSCTVRPGNSSCRTPMVNDAGHTSLAEVTTDTAGGYRSDIRTPGYWSATPPGPGGGGGRRAGRRRRPGGGRAATAPTDPPHHT
ncbi:DUF2690 domain-containing protein, partial [Streptomyces sp. NPDC059556]|uniref:DUF2690 domain-containing protein n=1 Tax=Streptomyces sp. NPDC059556 TaxID=3346863 RepID=UPI0036BC792C